MDSYPSNYLVNFKLLLFLYLQSLTLLELAAHLEGKAAQLRCEGLGKVKIALAGTDISSLLEILEECFGHINLDTSRPTVSTEKAEKETTVEEEKKTSQPPFLIVVVWLPQS